MDYSHYRKIVESENEIDSATRKELLSEYLKTPSLPHLQSLRDLLGEMKSKLNRCDDPQKKCLKSVRDMLNKKRSG